MTQLHIFVQTSVFKFFNILIYYFAIQNSTVLPGAGSANEVANIVTDIRKVSVITRPGGRILVRALMRTPSAPLILRLGSVGTPLGQEGTQPNSVVVLIMPETKKRFY